MVNALGVAGRPLLVEFLQLPLPVLDLQPEGLALEFVLDDGPLGGGEHIGVKLARPGKLGGWLLLLLLALIIWVGVSVGIGSAARGRLVGVVGAGLLGSLAELLDLGWGGLLRLGGGVDLAGLTLLISMSFLSHPVG